MTNSPSSSTLPCENIADLPANAPGPDPQIDESAMALLKASAEAMLALTSYRAECWATMFGLTTPARTQPLSYEIATLTSEKPNLMRYDSRRRSRDVEEPWPEKAETPDFTFVCDGNSAWKQFGKIYYMSPHTGPEYQHTISEPWQGFYSSLSSPYAMAEHLRTQSPVGQLLEARHDGREIIDGIACDVVFIHYVASNKENTLDNRTTWYIGDDGFIRRQVESAEVDGGGSFIRDSVIRHLETNIPIANPETLYVYTPPEGVTLQEREVKSE